MKPWQVPHCERTDKADPVSAEDHSMPIDAPERSTAPAPEEPTVTVSNGRRRGKRKVMKKKTMKDSEGYLGELSYDSCD